MDHIKISVVFENDDQIITEALWATKIGDYFKIDNIPFYVPNIAYNDIISATEKDGEFYFDKLIKASGHSVIQLVFFEGDQIEKVVGRLIKLGCEWEQLESFPIITLDIPPEVNYPPIKIYLDKCQEKGILDYKEACLGFKTT